MSQVPSPHELYRQAGGNTAEYLRLMEDHGHLVPRRADRCKACGVSKQQILEKHNELVELLKRAAPFVNAIAVIADDKGPALGWLASAAGALRVDITDPSSDHRATPDTPGKGER